MFLLMPSALSTIWHLIVKKRELESRSVRLGQQVSQPTCRDPLYARSLPMCSARWCEVSS